MTIEHGEIPHSLDDHLDKHFNDPKVNPNAVKVPGPPATEEQEPDQEA
jgi:hypothetical protein